ncbi:hypothetical protein HRG84_02245 [Flavisolibacter sp. BT320]|nr:hypothetical protein [Flavisolibacter longurius]
MLRRTFLPGFFLLATVVARAQFNNSLPPAGETTAIFLLTAGAEGSLPVGSFGKMTSIGLGAEAKAWLFGSGRGATLGLGLRRFSGKSTDGSKLPSATLVPVKAGYLLFFAETFFAEPQVGYSFGSTGSKGFTYSIGLGSVLGERSLLTARFETVSAVQSSLRFLSLQYAFALSAL